ncbi:hypothetical protein BC937DRAFT_86887 [Endogone sp. FLAS-F59071]|nr:hypothetical protein BC937DRAFT_86887 [Endogone sp. FLAS-F59071]|eukprot:RUS12841.1 hypothetical protein BC937DRAFT_86887 [Endogone sp. FLAS-F59071]
MSSDHDHGHDHDHSSCADHAHAPTPYTQTLDELDFQRSLHSACAQNDLARARQILDKKSGRAADERDANGYTPLVRALSYFYWITLPNLTNTKSATTALRGPYR